MRLSKTARDVATIVAAAAVLLLPSLARVDLFNPDEPREAEIAREMLASGDLVVPTFNGCPFLEKPPLFYWSVLALRWVPAASPEAGVRLPSALAALGLLLVTYAIGRRLDGRRTGRAAALLLLTTFQFWWLARRALLDMTLAFFVGAVMLCFLMAVEAPPARRGRFFLLAGLAASGAALSKGLIGLLIPGLAILVYLAWTRGLRMLAAPAAAAAAALPLAALGAWVALLARRADGAALVREFLIENHVKRFLGGGAGGHAQPLHYYLVSLATDYLPWTLFLPGALLALWPGLRFASRRDRGRDAPQRPSAPGARSGHYTSSAFGEPSESLPTHELSTSDSRAMSESIDGRVAGAFVAAWLLPSLLVLSVASSKRSIYLLPLAPAIALAVALWWRRRSEDSARARAATRAGDASPAARAATHGMDAAFSGALLLFIALVAACALALVVGALAEGRPVARARDLLPLPEGSTGFLAIALGVVLGGSAIAVAAAALRRSRRAAPVAVAWIAILLGITGFVVIPLASPRLSARKLGEAIVRERARGAQVAASGITEGSLGQFLYYSGGTVDWIGRKGEVASACCDCRQELSAEDFLEGPKPRACLVGIEDFERLASKINGLRTAARATVGSATYVLAATDDRHHPGPK